MHWLFEAGDELLAVTDWNGNGPGDGQGHGTEQYAELYNLIDGMQNGGTWDVLGLPLKADGLEVDLVDVISETNDGTGGSWNDFSNQVTININLNNQIYLKFIEDHDDWISSLNPEIMPSGWSNDYTGPNSFYTSVFDNEFGWREPGPPPSVIPTLPECFGCCRKIGHEFDRTACHISIDPEDLAHVTCLMDEQLNLIEQYFLANGMGQTDALTIKDEAKKFLEANAIIDENNPDLVNWFSGLHDIYHSLDIIYPQVTPSSAGEFAISLSFEPVYFTLITQLQLMSDIGDPSNKDQVNKDQFKSIDWNSVIPSGTTISSFDSASVLSAAETEIINAGGTVPAGLADSISRTGDDAQQLFTPRISTTTPMAPPTTHIEPSPSTLHPGTPMPTPPTTPGISDVTSPVISSTSAPTPTATQSTTVESVPSPTQSSSLPTVTQIATQTDAVSGSGGANSNGFGNDITNGNGITNSNGLGSMFGDPHIRIKNPNEPAICFDIEGQSFYNPQMIDHSLQECIWTFSIF